ncbi:MAG: thioredoxin family protein [Nitrososphaerales archaeon]
MIGERAPDFDLSGVDGKRYSLASFDHKQILVVIFTGNGCPTARAHEDTMKAIQENYSVKGVQLLAINSNNSSLSPPDSFSEMIKKARDKSFNFPYLKDLDRRVAREYGAICTPHVFIFDELRTLRYKGRIDDSRDPSRVITRDLQNALDDLIAGRNVRVSETNPFGCSVVW